MDIIQRYSQRIRRLFQALLVLIPLALFYFWFISDTTTNGFIDLDVSAYTSVPLSRVTQLQAFAASMLPSGIIMYALVQLIKLFKLYEAGIIFKTSNVVCYQKLGYTLFLWSLGSVVYSGLISVILSFNNPPGQRVLQLSVGSFDLVAIICGIIVLMISWVMKEGQKIAEENSHTV